jgi:hypothetical protein
MSAHGSHLADRDPRGPRWAPILEGGRAERARAAVERVADALARLDPQDQPYGASAASGGAGFAILFAELARSGREGAADLALAHLDAAGVAVATTPMAPSLVGGFLSVAWTLNLLQGVLLEPSDEPPAAEIEEVLVEHLKSTPWRRDYDLISGLVGFGVYALARHPSDFSREALRLIVDRLEELARPEGDGVAWFTLPELLPDHQRAVHPDGYYNVGLAHGIPGVISMLGQAVTAGAVDDRAGDLLRRGLVWLDQQRLPDGERSVYPSIIGAIEATGSRLAWCYGDPGVAASLLLASPDRRDQAVDVMRRAAARPMDLSGVRDAGICHGSAGLAHIYNRFWQATGEEVFRDQAISWIDDALARADPEDQLGGFPAATTDAFQTDPGLLSGSAGVALVLLAALEDRDPLWDQLLMMSAAAPAEATVRESGASGQPDA